MILSADFNINFADDRNVPVIDFFNEALGLTMPIDRKLSTAKYKTMINAVFTHAIFINFSQKFLFHILVTISLLYPF